MIGIINRRTGNLLEIKIQDFEKYFDVAILSAIFAKRLQSDCLLDYEDIFIASFDAYDLEISNT